MNRLTASEDPPLNRCLLSCWETASYLFCNCVTSSIQIHRFVVVESSTESILSLVWACELFTMTNTQRGHLISPENEEVRLFCVRVCVNQIHNLSFTCWYICDRLWSSTFRLHLTYSVNTSQKIDNQYIYIDHFLCFYVYKGCASVGGALYFISSKIATANHLIFLLLNCACVCVFLYKCLSVCVSTYISIH